MTEDSSSTYCRRCSRHLKNPLSIKHGYGNVCYHKRMTGDSRTGKREMDPCSIISPEMASKVYQAIYRLVRGGPGIEECSPSDLAHGQFLTGEDTKTLPVESFDHDAGMVLPGFGKPQWFYLHSKNYDLAIWKIRITDKMIMNEMERVGDIPKDWKRK